MRHHNINICLLEGGPVSHSLYLWDAHSLLGMLSCLQLKTQGGADRAKKCFILENSCHLSLTIFGDPFGELMSFEE